MDRLRQEDTEPGEARLLEARAEDGLERHPTAGLVLNLAGERWCVGEAGPRRGEVYLTQALGPVTGGLGTARTDLGAEPSRVI